MRLLRPEIALAELVPRWVVDAAVRHLFRGAGNGWVEAGVDEFPRAYHTRRGGVALYSAARQIYLEEPEAYHHSRTVSSRPPSNGSVIVRRPFLRSFTNSK
jgi:hypothetical protein